MAKIWSRPIVELLTISAVGIAVGLTANAVSGNGIAMNKNHFATRSAPGRPDPPAGDTTPDPPATNSASQNDGPPPDRVEAIRTALIDAGYQILSHDEVVEVYQDPATEEEERYIFVDARDDAHYAKGHLRGAYQLDHYRVDRYLADLLPACELAEKVIVYCNGGECDDSKLATNDLLDAGVPADKIFIYLGGVEAWRADGLPFERGERLSDDEVFLDDDE